MPMADDSSLIYKVFYDFILEDFTTNLLKKRKNNKNDSYFRIKKAAHTGGLQMFFKNTGLDISRKFFIYHCVTLRQS